MTRKGLDSSGCVLAVFPVLRSRPVVDPHLNGTKTQEWKKLTRSALKGVLNRVLFAYKSGRFAGSFLLLGIGFS